MAILDTYISDLLYQYDCVVIPGFGGFVANYRPAKIDADRGRFHPPGKDIGFNINLQKNDGLLSSFLSDKKKLTPDEAAQLIRSAVDTYKFALERGESLSFHKIGVLHLDKDKRIHFAPSNDINYLRSSFGLESFSLPRIAVETVKNTELAEAVPPNRQRPLVSQLPAKPTFNRKWYWTAAALVPILGFSYFALNTQDTGATTLAEIFSFKTDAALYTPVSHKNLSIPTANTELPSEETGVYRFSFLPETAAGSGVWINPNPTVANLPAEKAKEIPGATTGLYHIIVGCFSEEQNAIDLVSHLRKSGNDAAILDYHHNLYRVKTASFSDYQTALDSLFALKEGKMPKAWLLKKAI